MSQIDVTQTKKWYVIYVQAKFVKKLVEELKHAIQSSSLKESFGEIIVPTERLVEMKNGRKRHISKELLLPGYILIQMVMNNDSWNLVREFRRKYLLNFLGNENRPTPLSQREVDDIFEPLRANEGKSRPKVLFQPGQMVKVISEVNPFFGFKGLVETADYEKNRLQVSVTVFQRATSLELNFGEVEPV
jgi:transcriptional antiterminator NusG